jgi:hypothetical protein
MPCRRSGVGLPAGPAASAGAQGALLEQRSNAEQVVALAAGQVERHRPPLGVGAQVQLGREAVARAAEGLLARRTPRPGGMGVGADHAAVEQVHVPARIRRHGAQFRDDAAPDPGSRPALQTAPRGPPVHHVAWQVAPGRPGAGQPEDGLDKATVIEGGAPGSGLLMRQQGREPTSHRVGQHGSNRHPAQMRSYQPHATPLATGPSTTPQRVAQMQKIVTGRIQPIQ